MRRETAAGYRRLVIRKGMFRHRAPREATGQPGWVYAGVALLRREVIPALDRVNIFDRLEESSMTVAVVIQRGIWLDLGTPAGYFYADRRIRDRESPGESISMERGVQVDARSKVRDSILWTGSRVEHSILSRCIVTGDLKLVGVKCRDRIIMKRERKILFHPLCFHGS